MRLDQSLDAQSLLIAENSWYPWAPSRIVNLGLDLRGGAHVLVEVSLEEVYSERLASYWPEMRNNLRNIKEKVGSIRQVSGGINELLIKISRQEGLAEAIALIKDNNKIVIKTFLNFLIL